MTHERGGVGEMQSPRKRPSERVKQLCVAIRGNCSVGEFDRPKSLGQNVGQTSPGGLVLLGLYQRDR